jgi:hypothetical protein
MDNLCLQKITPKKFKIINLLFFSFYLYFYQIDNKTYNRRAALKDINGKGAIEGSFIIIVGILLELIEEKTLNYKKSIDTKG